jgi:hypothetical protein
VDEVLRVVMVAALATMLLGLAERTSVDAHGLRIAAVHAPPPPPHHHPHPGPPPA